MADTTTTALDTWISGFNMPGYLPDTDVPAEPTTWADARDHLMTELLDGLSTAEEYGDDADLIEAHQYAINALAILGEGEPYAEYVGNLVYWLERVS